MERFDDTFAKTVVTRFGELAEDATPQWGTMSKAHVIGHLEKVLCYTLGQGPEMPFRGNFMTRNVFRHLVLFGLREIPHNIRVPRPEGVTKEQFFPSATIEELATTIDTYLAAIPTGTLATRIHPFFGPLNTRAWQRFHRLHFIHHMKQFDLGEGF